VPPDPARHTFDGVADRYERARPGYPEALFDDLARLAHLTVPARILEIGCGTGQATLPLARRGHAITCVELGPALAARARAKLASYPDVSVVVADFETWQPEVADFDAVVAFTALHWITPALRYGKPAALLREGGHLAVVSTHHVLPPGGDPFFADVQADYIAVAPHPDNDPPPDPATVADNSAEIAASGALRSVAATRYVWDDEYTADEYIDLLGTYSGHLAMDPGVRARLLERIRARIEGRPEGIVRKSYLTILDVARRL
jgi:SAM-dependent methyltransferase